MFEKKDHRLIWKGERHLLEVQPWGADVIRVRATANRDFAAVGRLLQRHTGPIFPLIEDLFGRSIVEVHQEIAATLISPALAGGLKVKAGTAALEIRRPYKMSNGEIAQVTINSHPASRFRHSMTTRRVKG